VAHPFPDLITIEEHRAEEEDEQEMGGNYRRFGDVVPMVRSSDHANPRPGKLNQYNKDAGA